MKLRELEATLKELEEKRDKLYAVENEFYRIGHLIYEDQRRKRLIHIERCRKEIEELLDKEIGK